MKNTIIQNTNVWQAYPDLSLHKKWQDHTSKEDVFEKHHGPDVIIWGLPDHSHKVINADGI